MTDNNFKNPISSGSEYKISVNNDELFKDAVEDTTCERKENTLDFSKAERDCGDLVNYLNENKDNFKQIVFLEKLDQYHKEHKRLIYSAVTKTIYDLSFDNDASTDRILQNLSSLHNVSLNGSIVLKLIDHINLAIQQHNFISRKSDILLNNFNGQIKKAAKEQEDKFDNSIHDKIKSTEKDYITILGIFASIVLAFVAGFAFNTSVLENMHNNSVYRIVLVSCLISEGTIHLVYLLMSSIYRIYKSETYTYPKWMKIYNYAVISLTMLLTVAYEVENYNRLNLNWHRYLILSLVLIVVVSAPLLRKLIEYINFKRKLKLINEVNCVSQVLDKNKTHGVFAGLKELSEKMDLVFGGTHRSKQVNQVKFVDSEKFNEYYRKLIKFNAISFDTYEMYKNNKEKCENAYIKCKYEKKNLKRELKKLFEESKKCANKSETD